MKMSGRGQFFTFNTFHCPEAYRSHSLRLPQVCLELAVVAQEISAVGLKISRDGHGGWIYTLLELSCAPRDVSCESQAGSARVCLCESIIKFMKKDKKRPPLGGLQRSLTSGNFMDYLVCLCNPSCAVR